MVRFDLEVVTIDECVEAFSTKDNSKHFLLNVGIAAFSVSQCFAGKCDRSPFLEEGSAKSIQGCINLYSHCLVGIEVVQSHVVCDGVFHFLESSIICVIPLEVRVLLQQLSQWCSSSGEIRNEGTHVRCHAQKLLQLCDVRLGRHVLDICNLGWVRMDAVFVIQAAKEAD